MNASLKNDLPHLDPQWVQEVIVELRLRGASGDHIGQALAEVESHMAEAGGDVADTFGNPKDYAAMLIFPEPDGASLRAMVRTVVTTLLIVVGAFVGTSALTLVTKDTFEISVLSVVVLVVAALALCLAMALSRSFFRFLVEHLWVLMVAIGIIGGLTALPLLIDGAPTVTITPWLGVVVGVLLSAAGFTWAVVSSRRDGSTIRLPHAA